MIRLKDIAENAGVSVMTVSKALRGMHDVAPSTRERICAIARTMGYVPNAAAQGLRNRRTRLLGLVIPAPTDPVYSRVMLAIEERSHELGYDLILAHSLGQPGREEAVLHRLIARNVDGIFLSPVWRLEQRAPAYDELIRRNVPVVVLGHRPPFCSSFTGVETDDLAASASVTRHLWELGHRRIAFFAGPLVSATAQERLEGYRKALRELGGTPEDSLLFNAGSTIEEGSAAALQFVQESTGATAIQAVNDLVAVGAATTLLSQGVRIPADISIAGFGNVLVSEHFRVPLTTVRQPKLRLGSVAMDTMVHLLRGEKPAVKRLPAELVVRASTGVPPAQS